MQIFAGTKRQNEKKQSAKTKPRNKNSKQKFETKIRNKNSKQKSETKNSKQIKHCNELKKPRDLLVAGLFLLKYFIAFPSVWRGGKNVEINTLGS